MASPPAHPPTKPFLLGAVQVIGLAAALLTTGAARQVQATSLVLNGSFETLLQPGVSAQFGAGYSSQQVTNWTTSGYNFVFAPGTADTTGTAQAVGQYGGLSLWGPNDGAANGLPAYSPDGGNYIGADGAYDVAAITQTLTGLSPGSVAVVSFDWAGAQQYNYTGVTTEQWIVGFGNEPTQATAAVQNLNHGFTGWMQQTFSFAITSTTAVLSFLAVGTPNGEPPFSLLDGVSLIQVPEPATWAILLSGVGLAGLASRRRVRR